MARGANGLGFGGSDDASLHFMASALLVFGIIAAACSSPQTTEINANARADSLMKWVIIGMVESALFVGIAAIMDRDHWPTLLGGGLAGGIMWISYAHAKSAGLKSNLPGTEQYS